MEMGSRSLATIVGEMGSRLEGAEQSRAAAARQFQEAQRKEWDIQHEAKQRLAPLLVRHFGSSVVWGLQVASKEQDRESPEDQGWVMGPNEKLFLKRWHAPVSRDITAACDKLHVTQRDALHLILVGLVKAGRVEDADGSILPDEQFGGYSIYRLPRK